MSRTITISTDVFAAIWANRQGDEETEDAMLRRVLGCGKEASGEVTAQSETEAGGVYDTRNNVHFPRGFEAIRTYKRREYRAIAQDGVWLREDTGDVYPTLNQLNGSIAAGAENIWNGNWKYRAEGRKIRSINDLRC